MEFYSTVMVLSGTISLILALITGGGNTIIIIAMVKNPLHKTHKPVDRIVRVMIAVFFLAGMILLPYFGITEILRGANSEETRPTRSFLSFVSIFADFLIGSKLSLQLLLQTERFAAYVHPHFHRLRFTKRATTLISLFIVAFSLFFSLLVLTGIDEQIYHGVFIHLFGSCSWLAVSAISWSTYRQLKNRRTRIVPDETSQIPQLREKTELERARKALGARKYLLQVVLWYSPFVLFVLPWYIVKFMRIVCDVCLATNASFFWQRFLVPLAFVPDAFFTLFIISNEYASTVRLIFC